MATQDLIIEEWIPKWSINTYRIDFRVIVIQNKVVGIMARGSKHMITNLHLGNLKMELSETQITTATLNTIKTTALQAMECFPGLHYAGIDILVDRSEHVYVLEVNAFGDMILGMTDASGKTIYELEYESLFLS